MKKIVIFISIILALGTLLPASTFSSEIEGNADVVSEKKVEVYYFHYSRRCATCQAVEDESLKALKELYPEAMKNGTLIFLTLNIEEDKNQKIAEDLEVDGQTLLVVKGDKKKNLTNTAFMNARTNPDKLKKAFKDFIGSI